MALVVKNLPANAGDIRDTGSIPGSGRPPEGGHGNSIQYFCLENPMDRGPWQAMVHRVAKSQTQLKQFCTQFSTEVDKITCRYCSGLHSEFTHALIVEHVIKYLCNSLLCDIVLLFQYFIVKLPRISLYSSIVELV